MSTTELSPEQQRARILAQGARQVERAEDAFDAIRSICQSSPGPMPAPIVYDVVASLGRTTDHLGEAFTRLGRRLDQSLMAPELYTVLEESPDQDPFVQAHVASEHLYDAYLFAQKAAKSLHYARTAIAGQKYTTPPTPMNTNADKPQ